MCGSGRDEEPSGGEALRLIQIRLATLNFEKILPARQGNLPHMRTTTSSSKNAGNFSSGAQRFLSPLSASAVEIVRENSLLFGDCRRCVFAIDRLADPS